MLATHGNQLSNDGIYPNMWWVVVHIYIYIYIYIYIERERESVETRNKQLSIDDFLFSDQF